MACGRYAVCDDVNAVCLNGICQCAPGFLLSATVNTCSTTSQLLPALSVKQSANLYSALCHERIRGAWRYETGQTGHVLLLLRLFAERKIRIKYTKCCMYGQIVQFSPRDAMHKRGLCGGAENVGPENSVPNSRDWKMQDWKVTDQNNKPNFCQYVHWVVSDCLQMK